MSKGLASFPEADRMRVAMRRSENNERGNGWSGAVSFLNSKGIYTKEQKMARAVKKVMEDAAKQVVKGNKLKKWENDNGEKNRSRRLRSNNR